MQRDNVFITDLETHLRGLRLRIEELESLSAGNTGDNEVEHGPGTRSETE